MKMTIALLFIVILSISSTCHSQEIDYQAAIERAEALRNEANALVGILEGPRVGASSTGSSIDIILKALASTLTSLDSALLKAGGLMDTTAASIQRLEPEISNTLKEVQLLTAQLRLDLDKLSTVLREEIRSTGETLRVQVTEMQKQLSGDLEVLFNAGVVEIRKVGGQSYEVLVKVEDGVEKISTSVDDGVQTLTSVIEEEIGASSTTMQQSLTLIINAGVTSIEKLTTDASAILVEIKQQVEENGQQVQTSIEDLTEYVAGLTAATTGFIAESTQTLHDIRMGTRQIINWVDSIEGRISTGYYYRTDGQPDSMARIDLWYDRPGKAIKFVRLGAVDLETTTRFDIRFGVTKGITTFSAGYIERGLGLALGLNDFGDKGPWGEIRAYNFSNGYIDIELGYHIGAGITPFVFADDTFHSARTFGGGVQYNRRF